MIFIFKKKEKEEKNFCSLEACGSGDAGD